MTKRIYNTYEKFGKGTNSGYKASGRAVGNSSFWMDDEFLEKSNRGVDVIKLASYKRAISNFVRIVTGKDNIPVMYSSGKDSYTEGSVVIISSKLNEKEFDSTVGLALHEGSHCALTDFQALKRFQTSGRFFEVVKKAEKAFPGAANNPLPDIKALVNIIEDRRIDQFIYKSAPGYNGYYQAMYDTYFNNPIITQALINNWKTEVTMDCYMFHICNFANPNRNLQALPKLQEIWDEIGLSTISRLKTTSEVIEVA